jgi:hypothetical protein
VWLARCRWAITASTSKGSGEREPGGLGRQGERIRRFRDLVRPEIGGRRAEPPRLVEAVVVGEVRARGAGEVGVVVQPGPAAVLADDGGDDVEAVA